MGFKNAKKVKNPDVRNNDYVMYYGMVDSEDNKTIELPGSIDTIANVRVDLRARSFDEVRDFKDEVRRIVHANSDLRQLTGNKAPISADGWSYIINVRKTEKSQGARGDSLWWWLYDLRLAKIGELFP